MGFMAFVLKNVARRPMRSALTALSMAIGVGAVVALVGISERFQTAYFELFEHSGIDLVVNNRNPKRLEGELDESLGEKFLKVNGVTRHMPVLVDTTGYPEYDLPIVPIQGQPAADGDWWGKSVTVIEGDPLGPGQRRCVMLGESLALAMDKKSGDKVKLFTDYEYTVVGVFRSDSFFLNSIMMIDLPELQELTNKKGRVSGFSIAVKQPVSSAELNRIQRDLNAVSKDIRVMKAREHIESLTEIKLFKAMSWLTSAIALMIGSVGMVNTMIMSVHERIGEIGVLRAMGWRKSRVVEMVISEAVALSFVGGILGSLAAVALVGVLARFPMVQGVIDGSLPGLVILMGIAISLSLGLFGGVFPALKASRLAPTVAIRYE